MSYAAAAQAGREGSLCDNLGFTDAIRRLRFGFALQQETFLSFKIRPQ